MSAGRAWHVGATPAPLPDPSTEWGWSAQQAYAVATARRVNDLGAEVAANQTGTLVVAGVVGLLSSLVVVAGYQLWRRGI